jgi:Zn-dependent protease
MYPSYYYQILQQLIYTVPAVLLAITAHEFAHGYVSYRLGDPTPKMDGRLSMNPLKHLDLMGTLCLLFFHMGWAKPVRVCPRYYKDPRKGMIKVALAGPIMNFIMAFLSLLVFGVILRGSGGSPSGILAYFYSFTYYLAVLNVGLGVFNLIPIPPLDGSNVLRELFPKVQYYYQRAGRYMPLILIVLLMTGVLSRPLTMADNGIINALWGIVKKILGIGYISSGGGIAI